MDDFKHLDNDTQLRILAMKMALEQWADNDSDDIALAADTIYRFLKDGSTPE